MTQTIEQTVSQLCLELHHKASAYEGAARDRAQADVAYRQARAQRILRAQADGARSVAQAENEADADQIIADLRLKHLVAEAVCDGLTKSMIALRTRIDFGRSRMATEREADKLLATSREAP